MYLILLLVVFAITGLFAVQNDQTQTFTLLSYSWSVPIWTPAVIGVGVVSALLMLHMSHAGMGSQLRSMSQDRMLDEHRGRLDDLRAENAGLREELAAARGEVRGAVRVTTGRSWFDGIRTLPSRFSRRSST
jgi:hypothetical protein